MFGTELLVAGRSLDEYMRIMRENPCIVGKTAAREMLAALDMHMRACRVAQISYTPKHHVVCHMTLRTAPFHFLCVGMQARLVHA